MTPGTRTDGDPAPNMTRIDTALNDLRSLDEFASRDTALTRVDPRAKLVATLLFTFVVVSFDRYSVAALLPLALFPTVLAAQAELPPRLLLRILCLASPFALMVGIFNPALDRAPMLVLHGVAISGGWVSLAAILLRFGLTASAALVLVAGTGMQPLCAALARLGAPTVFTMQLLFLYRYLFVLASGADRMSTASRLRAGGQTRLGLAGYTSLLGHLLLRAIGRAQRIHGAMLARGFDGEIRLVDTRRWQHADTLFISGWCGFFVCVRSVDLPHAIGTLLASAVT
jgi:cobalt/nickel transport system permease protein